VHGSDQAASTQVDALEPLLGGQQRPRRAVREDEVRRLRPVKRRLRERRPAEHAPIGDVDHIESVGAQLQRRRGARTARTASARQEQPPGKPSYDEDCGRDQEQASARERPPTPNRLPLECSSRGRRELPASGEAIVALLRERGCDHVVEAGRQLRPDLRETWRQLVQVREHDRQLALAVEGALPRETLEENAAERVDVGAPVDRAALDLLGRHVVDRADETALAGQAAHRRDVPREAEVADVGTLALVGLRDEDVARLDVAVHEPCRVRRVERARDLLDQMEYAVGLEPSFTPQQLPQVGTVDVVHREVERAVLLARSVCPDDVGVVQARRQLGLAQEPPPEALIARQLRPQ
jgi:hypothetical protein